MEQSLLKIWIFNKLEKIFKNLYYLVGIVRKINEKI